MPRAFIPADQDALQQLDKDELWVLVKAQRTKWPKNTFNKRKTKKDDIIAELLRPENGFTTDWPLVHPPQTAVSPPVPPPTSVTPLSPPVPPPTSVTPLVLGPATSTASMHIPSAPARTTPLVETHIKRPVKVYIHDERPNTTPKTVQIIEVTVVDRVGCLLGEWRANAMEIYQQIQVSNAAITGRGAIKIGVPDEHDPAYTHFFLRGELQLLSWAKPVPDRLKISKDSKLTLRVARYWQDEAAATPSNSRSTKSPLAKSAKSLSLHKRPSKSISSKALARPYVEVSSEDDIDTLSPAKQVRFSYSDSPSPSQLVRERRLQDHQHDVEWLVNVLKGQPGFEDFIEKRNRRLNNPDVVLHWAFATRVTEDYHLKMSGAPGSSTGRLITKTVIQEALGVGETTLAQAIEATKILRIYGEHGTHPADAVIAETNTKHPIDEKNSGRALGSVELLKFLRRWKTNNPV